MNKRLVLVDWDGNEKEFDIPDFENVLSITIKVLTGDEVAGVCYKNGDIKVFDSSDDRLTDYLDCLYQIPLNKNEEFNNLQDSSYTRAEIANSLWERSEQ